MSFDLVPGDFVLKIFHHLPFKDRVRLGGVNRLFKEISETSINKMRSVEINDDLAAYSISTLGFSSLLESCSSTLQSIDASNQPCSNRSIDNALLSALAEFVYPNLKHLKMTVGRFDNVQQAKRLISQSRNLNSIILHLHREFEFPEGIVFEKLEKLVVQATPDSGYINLSPTLRPSIGIVPNLKHLTIEGYVDFSVQEFSQLLTSTPNLEKLNLDVFCSGSVSPDFKVAISTWHLPKLITLYVNLHCDCRLSILHHFPAAFPRLESVTWLYITVIDDREIMALSQLKYLKELRLPELKMTKDVFTKMITSLPSITVLQINRIDNQNMPAEISQLEHLRELSLHNMDMKKSEIIDVITNVPSIFILRINKILDHSSPMEFIHFLMSTAALFQRNLEIRLDSMHVNAGWSDAKQLEAVLKEMEKNGGPVVKMNHNDVQSIHYRSLDG